MKSVLPFDHPSGAAPLLTSSTQALSRHYDVALLDLDGVVYVGADAVPGAPAALARAREAGMRLAFVTNNAARPPAAVAAHLRELGVPAEAVDVINAAQAAARYLAERLPAGARVLVCGTTGIIEALTERGLTPVFAAGDAPVAVLQGYSPTLDMGQLAEAAVAIGSGALWVATNLDRTVPSPRGPLPGNGSMVAALRHATGSEPISTGKPDPTMHAETVLRSGAERPLVVGDRLDTDIEGARAVGCDSLLVLSGVTTPADLIYAPDGLRPDFLALDLSGLNYAHPAVGFEGDTASCRSWRATLDRAGIELRGDGGRDCGSAADRPGAGAGAAQGGAADGLDGLRALCALAWSHGAAPIHAGDELAAATLAEWELT